MKERILRLYSYLKAGLTAQRTDHISVVKEWG